MLQTESSGWQQEAPTEFITVQSSKMSRVLLSALHSAMLGDCVQTYLEMVSEKIALVFIFQPVSDLVAHLLSQ